MRMKNRFCRMGKTLLGAVCLLSTCGVTYSCSDDFDLDEKSPSFLGQSIYDELKNSEKRKFTTVIRLIDDLNYKDVMSKTGSKTLFVADDDAYKNFFETTTWTDGSGQPVRSYEQLSTNQKKLLLNGSMLNNAYVLEMLTTIQGPLKNLCLRQLSAATAVDSVPYFKWDELPHNQSEGQIDASTGKVINADNRFWDYYRQQARGGMYLALDGTEPMMTHFLEAQLTEKKITHDDVSFVLNFEEDDAANYWGNDNTENRSYVYDARIIEPDNVCLNGYYHVLDKVLITPMNMAETIRTNGQTNYFSLLLDRFSAPYYDATLTEEYKALQEIQADSVFKKIYISQRSQLGNITVDPKGESLGDFPSLSFDPGWNAYSVNSSTKEQDMAAMFVPNDVAMVDYFVRGAGRLLIERYGTRANTEENLEFNLYQIPLNIVKPLVANLMKESFNETVPSKYLTVMNDAQDPMFNATQYPSVDAYKQAFEKVLLANNGAVYVMNRVIGPATYSSVMSPALRSEDTQVANTVIHADDAYTSSNYNFAPLRKFYSTYLLAMQSNFTLFVPMDDGLRVHGMVDPMAYSSGIANQYRFWNFIPEKVTVNNNDKHLAIRAQAYTFRQKDPMNTQTASTQNASSIANNSLASEWGKVKRQLMTDMMDHHILVHEMGDEGELGVRTTRNYFLSRSGAPVYIKKKSSHPEGLGMEVEGGMQIMFDKDQWPENDFSCVVKEGFDMSRATNSYGNGMTYFLDRPMQATLINAYKVMEETSEFNRFFSLCSAVDGSTDLLRTLFYDEETMTNQDDWTNELNKYRIFAPRAERPTANNTQLIRFFNSYRYNIFIPTAEALDNAFAEDGGGLMTMDQIREFVEANTVETEAGADSLRADAKVKAQAMVTAYVNFLKYHFSDNSLFVDNCTDQTRCSSACFDAAGTFIPVTVSQTPGAMTVTDAKGRTAHVGAVNNLFAREFELDNSSATSAREITSSSYVVLHGIDNYMVYDSDFTGKFSDRWATPAQAKKYLKKYGIKK